MQLRGQVSDVGGIILYVFAFFIMAIFVGYLISQIHAGFLSAYSSGGIPVGNDAKNSLNQIDAAGNLPVTLIPLVVMLLGLGSIVLSWYVPSNPAFLLIEVVILGVFEFLAAIFSNIMYAFISTPILAYIGNNNPITVAVIVHFPLVILFIAVMIMVVQSIRGSYDIPQVSSGGGPLR